MKRPRIADAAPYWVILHIIVIELAISLAVAVALLPSWRDDVSARLWFGRNLSEISQTAVWMLLPLLFVFSIHAKPYRWLWLSVVALALANAAIGFWGYLSPMGQLRFWRASRLGEAGLEWGAAIDLFAALAPAAIVLFLLGLHLRQMALGAREQPYAFRYSAIGLIAAALYAVYLGVEHWRSFELTIAYAPGGGTSPSLASPSADSLAANPLATPAHIVPEWWALPFYAILRAPGDKLIGVIAMTVALLLLMLLPWLDRADARPIWRRGRAGGAMAAILLTVGGLGYLGAQSLDDGRRIAAQVLTLLYVTLFLIALPYASRATRRSVMKRPLKRE